MMLCSGDGDMDTTGRCASDITHFCPEVKPGEGRIIKCLNNQKDDEEKGNVEGRKLNDECKEEMRNFKIERWVPSRLDTNGFQVDPGAPQPIRLPFRGRIVIHTRHVRRRAS
jgi:hypothetical protein